MPSGHAAMKRVFRSALLIDVAHARNLLLSAGIGSELRNQYVAGALGELPMLEAWPQLFVEDDDELPALRALSRATKSQAGTPWICERCAEHSEPQFTHCWRCGAAASTA